MSKYVILGIPRKDDKYTKNATLFFHTNTKYPDNEPYFSTAVTEYAINKYSIEKHQIPEILKLAQGKSYSCKRRNTKYYEKIIVLKVNSPKLKQYLD